MPVQQNSENVRILPLLGAFWTPANALSMARLLLAAPITYLVFIDGPLVWLIGLIMLAIVTDFFDGRVARWSHTVSAWGKVLDPVADKVLAAMVVLALVFREVAPNLPIWLLAMLVIRDVCIVFGGVRLAKKRGHVVMSTWAGKIAVTCLALTVVAALLKAAPLVIAIGVWSTALMLIYSSAVYIAKYRAIMQGERPPAEPSFQTRRPSVPTMKQEAGSV